MSSYSRQQLENWLKTIRVSGKVLDIGGSQNPINGRTKTWEVEDYRILDLDKPHETKKEPDIVADIQGVELKLFKEEFDIVFCIEVSEYWYNPLDALKNINQALKKGGKLYISFHFIYPVHNPESEDCLRYTRSGIKKLLQYAGFDIEEIIPRRFNSPSYAIMLYENERMRGLAGNHGDIHKEQGYMVRAVKF